MEYDNIYPDTVAASKILNRDKSFAHLAVEATKNGNASFDCPYCGKKVSVRDRLSTGLKVSGRETREGKNVSIAICEGCGTTAAVTAK